jgi:hypothetical protein
MIYAPRGSAEISAAGRSNVNIVLPVISMIQARSGAVECSHDIVRIPLLTEHEYRQLFRETGADANPVTAFSWPEYMAFTISIA